MSVPVNNLDFLDFCTLLDKEDACGSAKRWVVQNQYGLRDALINCPHPDWIAWLLEVELGIPAEVQEDAKALFDNYFLEWRHICDLPRYEFQREHTVIRDNTLRLMRELLLPFIEG